MTSPDQTLLRDALVTFGVVAALVTGFLQIDVELPAVGHLGSALVAVLFLYAPVVVGWRRGEDLDQYGFHQEPVRRGLVMAGVSCAIILPLFSFVYVGFFEVVCDDPTLRRAMADKCVGYLAHGVDRIHPPDLSWLTPDHGRQTTLSLEWCLIQFVVVSLPEELFFRGFLHELFERRFPPRWRWLGGGLGLALVLSSVAFALIHLPKYGYSPEALATFFPGLLFGWMRSATGSILAPTLTHALFNIAAHTLGLMLLR